MMYLSADELFTPPGLSNLGGKCLSSAKSSRDTAVNKKAMQEQGRRDERARWGKHKLFLLQDTSSSVSQKPHGSPPEIKGSIEALAGQRGQSAAEVN